TASLPLLAVMPVTYTDPSALTATSGLPSPPIVVPFRILCQLSDPSGPNLTTKIFGLGLPNGSLVKLSVIPTTYELPSAALATPSATSLPTPPHVVCVSSIWPCAVAAARATCSNATHAISNSRIAEQRSAIEDVTDFSLIGIWFFMVSSIILS